MTEAALATSDRAFAAHYDTLIEQPQLRSFYGDGGFFNTGLWTDDTPDPRTACEELVGRLLDGLPPHLDAVLDVACGLGGTSRLLARRFPGARVAAVNLSPRQLAVARGEAPQAAFLAQDAARLAFRDRSFDLLVSVEAAFHFRTRRRFLVEAARVLRPGASLRLSDILFAHPDALGPGMVPADNVLEGPESYARLLAETGFEAIEIEDSTGPCWNGFLDSLARWAADEAAAGRLSPDEARAHGAMAARLGPAARHYLLVAARRTDG